MNADEIMQSEDFKSCAAFHGHVCPGLSLGYRAAKAGMYWIEEQRSSDEELVAIVETDACSADAVQVLTGCTFGKGNFLFKDFGKMALTLFSRATGRGVRVSLRPGAFEPGKEHRALIQKVIGQKATNAEIKRFNALHEEQSRRVLEAEENRLFTISPVKASMPPRARIEPSVLCDRCGEPVMPSKMTDMGDKRVCRGCVQGGC